MSLKYEPSLEPLHISANTDEFDSFLKSQLASTQLALGPYVVPIGTR
jgi:hypothetical protein